MEKLIVEIQDRSLNQYHVIEKFPTTLGRAFDNDIIISDKTISPHHLVIDADENAITITNLSTENGSNLNNQALAVGQSITVSIPTQLELGLRSIRLLTVDTPIERTMLSTCRGIFAIFCHPIVVSLLALLTLAVILLENYFSTEYSGSFINYISKIIPSLWFLLALTVLALGVNRVVRQQWDVWPSIAIASLFVLALPVLSEIGHWWSYFLTADWPRDTLLLVNKFLVIPLLLFFFIYRLYGISKKAASGWALLLSAPIIVFQLVNLIDDWTIQANSVSELNFNRSVRASDLRLLPTLSHEEYMQQARDALGDPPNP